MMKLKISLPDSFYEEEERSGQIVTHEIKKVWAVELDLLNEFDRVCKILGTQYFLDSGTLLGAVRHKGFIPWDDDIDVIMLRDDYDKLIREGTEYFKYPYFLQSAYSDKNYFRGHGQLRNSSTTAIIEGEGKNVPYNQGIFIDIFVLDGVPDDDEETRALILEQDKYWILYFRMFRPFSNNKVKELLLKLRALLIRMIYRKSCFQLFKEFEEVTKRHKNTETVDILCQRRDPYFFRRLKREWFNKVEIARFEGFDFPIPVGYEKILKEYYGKDYMIPKHTATVHGTVLFNTEQSYKDYLKK